MIFHPVSQKTPTEISLLGILATISVIKFLEQSCQKVLHVYCTYLCKFKTYNHGCVMFPDNRKLELYCRKAGRSELCFNLSLDWH